MNWCRLLIETFEFPFRALLQREAAPASKKPCHFRCLKFYQMNAPMQVWMASVICDVCHLVSVYPRACLQSSFGCSGIAWSWSA